MMRYRNHRSSSPTLTPPRHRSGVMTPRPRWEYTRFEDEEAWCSEHKCRADSCYHGIRPTLPRPHKDEEDQHLGSPFTPPRVLGSNLHKDPTCRCGLFTPCRECRQFLMKESLGLAPQTPSRSQTTSEPENSPDAESQENDSEQENHVSLPDISSSRSLNLDMIGHTNALLSASRLLAQSTTYLESAMRMADIIFIVSSTSNESSTSKTSTDSASDHLKMIRAESALLKIIATYCQLQRHPSTLGTTRESTGTSYPQTASDLVLEDLTSLAMICGQGAWLKQTKHSFLKTLAVILREISSCSTAKFQTSQIQNGTQSLQNYLAWTRMESTSTGNVTRKRDAGSSRTSANRFRVSKQPREDSPTPLRRRLRMQDTVVVEVESDSDDQSL